MDRFTTTRSTMQFTLLILLVLPALNAAAQRSARPDPLQLSELRAAAAQQDPRVVQPELLARATQLRLAALRAQRLPQLAISGQATIQNEVPEIPINPPGRGLPPREQFRTQVEAEWSLYDGGRTRRQASAERAQLAEDVAGVAVTLYAICEATTETFFSASLSEARARTLALAAEDLEARLRVIRKQVAEGTALAAEAAALEAELIRVRQQVEEAWAARRAMLGVLAELTGTVISPSDTLAIPDLDSEVSQALGLLEGAVLERDHAFEEAAVRDLLGRPELARLTRAAERADAEARVRQAQTRPAVSLFGQAGLGRPSPFNFLSDDLSEYGLAGVRLRWSVVDWGRTRREAEAIRVQARLAENEAAAFIRQVARDIEDELANLTRLSAALADDDRAIDLREEALRAARRQLEEGILLPDIYTDRLTDLAAARLTRERHRIERARAQARLLSSLGRFPEARPHTRHGRFPSTRPIPAGDVEDLLNFE